MKKYYVVPFDILEVKNIDKENDSVDLSMYCEIGHDDFEPGSLPTFDLLINRTKGKITLTTDTSDWSPEEKEQFNQEINDFLMKFETEYENGNVVIPPTSEINGTDVDIEMKPC
jgi:hypothetical protein